MCGDSESTSVLWICRVSKGQRLRGPVLKGPVLEGRVLEGRVLKGRALEDRVLQDRLWKHQMWKSRVLIVSILLALAGASATHGQISAECQNVADANPEGVFEHPPGDPLHVYSVTHAVGWVGAHTITPTQPANVDVFSVSDANRTCETTTMTVSHVMAYADTWNVTGTVAGSVTAEAEAGAFLATVGTSATVSAQVGAGLAGTTTHTFEIEAQSPLPPCSAKQYTRFIEAGGATGTLPYADLVVNYECLFGDCAFGSAGTISTTTCGSTNIGVVVVGQQTTINQPGAGWIDLPPPDDCSDCDADADADDSEGEGDESGGGGLGGMIWLEGHEAWWQWLSAWQNSECALLGGVIMIMPNGGGSEVVVLRSVSTGLLELLPIGQCEDWIDEVFDEDIAEVIIEVIVIDPESE